MTVSLPPELNQALCDYAELYGEIYGQAEPLAELIPAMLASFLDGDRAFARWRRGQGRPDSRRGTRRALVGSTASHYPARRVRWETSAVAWREAWESCSARD